MYCARKWKNPRLIIALFIVELAGTVASLALFGIAAPDLFRTKLWRDGSDNGFNSSPNVVIFAYSNGKPAPKVALVWTQFLTNYNIVISVLSMFLLLLKAVAFVMHVWYPIFSILVHTIITALWTFSVYGQVSPDYADQKHMAKIPWYIAKSCSVAKHKQNIHGCLMAKGTFAVSVIMLAIFALHLPIAIWSMIPDKNTRHSRMSSNESDMMTKEGSDMDREEWELKQPPHLKVPMTPRTTAFNALSGNLPLRSSKK